MDKLRIEIGDGELWWCGIVDAAEQMPFSKASSFSFDIRHNPTYNQCNPVMLSNRGRYVWCEEYYKVRIAHGIIELESDGKIEYAEGFGSLRGAYSACSKKYFPFNGEIPFEESFTRPQYCSWIALMYNQTQEGVLGYARSIIEAGYPAGELIIDAGWQEDYGNWRFHPGRFSNPKAMMKELSEMGFKVSLWIVPYISPDSEIFREAEKADYLIGTQSGESFIGRWWDGYSAAVDFSNPAAVKWFYEKLKRLSDEYGVYGFKWDAGDSRLYSDAIVTKGGTTPNRQSEAYALSCMEFPINEIRACCKCAGLPIVQRIADRRHSWDAEGGLRGLIPKAVVQGLSGYPYLCPDMIGGGQFVDFMGKNPEELDEELMIRYCQCSCLMPMMQFSYPLWKNFGERARAAGKECCDVHMRYASYIVESAKRAAVSGEPLLQSLDYAFGIAGVDDEFMLGERVLAAPVLEKGQTKRRVLLPEGKWKYMPDGRIYEGGTVVVDAPVTVLPYFEKL